MLFKEDGTRSQSNIKTDAGSVFTGILKLTKVEVEALEEGFHQLIVPAGISTTFNGELLASRQPTFTTTAILQTEVADEEGNISRRDRKTTVQLYKPLDGETGHLFEMGIPIVETGDQWHYNVGQKVPLNADRDNVTPSYLVSVRAVALEASASALVTEEQANAPWIREVLAKRGEELSSDTINTVLDLKYGKFRVSYDPSDPEANNRAVSEGYTVVHGGNHSKAEWEAIRRVDAITPAGKTFATPKPFNPDGKPLTILDPSKYTEGMTKLVAYIHRIAVPLLGTDVTIHLTPDRTWGSGSGGPFLAAYGKDRVLYLNAGLLGKNWFTGPLHEINDLLIHEFGHHYESNHLDEKYYAALTKLGGRLVDLALAQPEIFIR